MIQDHGAGFLGFPHHSVPDITTKVFFVLWLSLISLEIGLDREFVQIILSCSDLLALLLVLTVCLFWTRLHSLMINRLFIQFDYLFT